MPFRLTYRRSSKSLPRLKVPSRKAHLHSPHSQNALKETKSKKRLKKVTLNLGDTVASLMPDGNWCTGFGTGGDEFMELLKLKRLQEKVCKENELLLKRHEILFDLAKGKTGELEALEKEQEQLRRIISKSALRFKTR